MDNPERNIALALILGRLESALAIIKGLEYKVFGITDTDRETLEPYLEAAKFALAEALQSTLRILPEGERPYRLGNETNRPEEG